MTPRRLRQFLALIEHAHFGRAAKALGVSQPALSKSIQLLENELGVTLFDRRTEGIVLTAFGQLLREKSRRLLWPRKICGVTLPCWREAISVR